MAVTASPVRSGSAGNPFSVRTIAIVVLLGMVLFVSLLWALGKGDMLRETRNGEAHAASTSLVGFKALHDMLGATGHRVRISRNAASFDTPALLVLTPNASVNAEDFGDVIRARRYVGPTMVVLPKWLAQGSKKLPRGWVNLVGPGLVGSGQALVRDIVDDEAELDVAEEGVVHRLRGTFTTGLTAPDQLVTLPGGDVLSMLSSGSQPVIAIHDNGGYFPDLEANPPEANSADFDREAFPVVIVADPDLFNNMGLADKARAQHAIALVDALGAYGGDEMVFDLAFSGLGSAENLLTLAFEPPFLSATLCLILAAIAAAWAAFQRFGPPLAEIRAIDFGKAALVRNSAGFVARMNRARLVAAPYATLVRERSAKRIGLHGHPATEEVEARLDRLGEYEGKPFSQLAREMEAVSGRADIANSASALRAWEKEFIG